MAAVRDFRAEGNAAFTAGDYATAIEIYSAAPTANAFLLGNRGLGTSVVLRQACWS